MAAMATGMAACRKAAVREKTRIRTAVGDGEDDATAKLGDGVAAGGAPRGEHAVKTRKRPARQKALLANSYDSLMRA